MSEDPIHDAIAIAREILSGSLDILNGCAKLDPLIDASVLKNDREFVIFTGVRSESDHLPFGPDRIHWDAEALKHKNEEIARVVAFYHQRVFTACRRLVERFGSTPTPENPHVA
jgi:hypothetical protein